VDSPGQKSERNVLEGIAVTLDSPAGETPAERVSVVELSKLAGISRNHYYLLARKGEAPSSARGVLLTEAAAWLKERADIKAARAAIVRRLEEMCARPSKERAP
jgi:predicted DNA-binding transcriptional regulator AlpA